MKRLPSLHLQCLPLAAAPPLPPLASTRIRPRSDPPNCARTDPSRSRPQTPPPEKTEREEKRRWLTSQPRYEKKKTGLRTMRRPVGNCLVPAHIAEEGRARQGRISSLRNREEGLSSLFSLPLVHLCRRRKREKTMVITKRSRSL